MRSKDELSQHIQVSGFIELHHLHIMLQRQQSVQWNGVMAWWHSGRSGSYQSLVAYRRVVTKK